MAAAARSLLFVGGSSEEASSEETVVPFAEEGGAQSVQLAQGQILEVRLRGNPTTGYAWRLEDYEAQEVVSGPADVAFESDAPDRMGAGGVFAFRFAAVGCGPIMSVRRFPSLRGAPSVSGPDARRSNTIPRRSRRGR